MGRREEAGWSVGKEVEAMEYGRGRIWVGGAWWQHRELQLASVLHCECTGIPVDFHGLSEL